MNRWLELLRAPAALTVLGDTVAGAAVSGRSLRGRRVLLPLSSVAFYWSGMALNDWADRVQDVVERPERPVPSGRITPGQAFAVAGALTAAGFGLAAAGGGRAGLRSAAPLAAAIWAYDLLLKSTPAGPLAMGLCRALDVLLGADPSYRRAALAPALVIGGHTTAVTVLSRGEVRGGTGLSGFGATAGTAACAAAAATGGALSAAVAATYLVAVAGQQWRAGRDPSSSVIRTATVTGIHGVTGLQAAFTAPHHRAAAAGLLALWPVLRRLSRKVSPT